MWHGGERRQGHALEQRGRRGLGARAFLAPASQAGVEPPESQRGPALKLIGVSSGGARRATIAHGKPPIGTREPLHQRIPTGLHPVLVHPATSTALRHLNVPETRLTVLTAVIVTNWAEHIPGQGTGALTSGRPCGQGVAVPAAGAAP